MRNNIEQCSSNGCKQEVVVHSFPVLQRTIINPAQYCDVHAREFLDNYNFQQFTGIGKRHSGKEGVPFDVELLIWDDRPDMPCQVSLREVGGTRRLDIGVGIFEVSALRWQLERLDTPRPLTHAVIASVIQALDGQLEYVAVDKYFTNQPVTFEAKLHIRRGRDARVVDVRPSDAFTLAVICDAPIVVIQDVLKG